jgi:DNA-binding transcriptional LysR family regulator
MHISKMLFAWVKGDFAMDIRILKEFNTLVMYGSYTPASKALFLSQSSLSRHIASLEKEVGQPLLFDTHPLTPTKAGEAVIKQTTEILSSYDAMMSALGALSHSKPELIRIQDRTHFESLYANIFKTITQVEKEYPNVTFDFVKQERVYTPIEALLAKKLDAAFRFRIARNAAENPALDVDNRLISIPMNHFQGELCIGIRRDSNLRQSGKRLSFADFSDTRFFVPAERHLAEFVEDFRKICAAEGLHPKIEMITTDSYLDFYSRVPEDGAVFLIRMHNEGHTSLDRCIKNNLAAILPESSHGPYYAKVALLARKDVHTEAFDTFLREVEKLETISDPYFEMPEETKRRIA